MLLLPVLQAHQGEATMMTAEVVVAGGGATRRTTTTRGRMVVAGMAAEEAEADTTGVVSSMLPGSLQRPASMLCGQGG